jgi:carboxylesterase
MSSSGDSDPPPAVSTVDTGEFFFDGAAPSTLLIHGLTGTPYEMRYLGEQLAARGMRTLGVKLAGHAGAPEELGAADHNAWYQSVVDGFERLRGHGDPVVAVGLSAGAVLAARLAADQGDGVAGLAMLAPAFFLSRVIQMMLGPLRILGPLANRIYLRNSGADIHDADARRIHPSAHLMPLSAPINLYELSASVRPRLGHVTQPVLIIHSRRDHTCPLRNVDFLMEHLGSRSKRAVILEESFHVITVDSEKERVAAEVAAFIGELGLGGEHRRATG